AAIVLGLGALLVGLLLGCVYRSVLAQQARDGTVTWPRLPLEAFTSWYRMLSLAIVLLVAMVLVVFPLAFIAAIASLMTAGATVIMTAVVLMLGLAAQLYLFFAPDAIFISRVGPIQAIRRSIAVVHAGVWSALTLAILITVILVGMGQVWIAL